ncbi:MAG: 16S rRNA (uracil(1498)-N(3))-methyltransferase [Eubacteriales bacterium]
MYQFFVEQNQISNTAVSVIGNDVNHIKNVLRMKIGEEIAISNGIDGKEYHCEIAEIQADEIICHILSVEEEQCELPAKIYLFQGLPKADKMELIIQKAVELGVYEIIPMATKRAVVKLDEKKAKSKIIRWQGIATAAAKQSKRQIIPNISNVMTLKEAIQFCESMDVKLIPYELAKGMDETKKYIQGVKKGQSVAVFIGPEGGFDEMEIQMAMDAGIMPITLGKRILRTETAGFTTLAWLMYQLEE